MNFKMEIRFVRVLGLVISSWMPDEPLIVGDVVERALRVCDWMHNEVIFCKVTFRISH